MTAPHSASTRTRSRSRFYLSVAGAIFCAFASSSCRAVTAAYGSDPANAKANADGVYSALEQRYTGVVRDAKFAEARVQISHYALTPSKLENESTIWTSRTGSSGATRVLSVSGTTRDGRYTFTSQANAPLPARIGDSRHVMRLSPLAEDEYQWATDVDHNVGDMPAQRAGDVFTALLASAERSPSAIRNDYRAAFPRTTRAVGRLFVIDSIATMAQADGSTLVSLQIFMDADRLRQSNPSMAKYVDKYVSSAQYRVRLTDRSGAEWFDARANHGERVTLRYRSRDGVLQPISGAARVMPDTLNITVNATAKFGIFTVGVDDMKGIFMQVRNGTADQDAATSRRATSGAAERGWLLRFQQEPEWRLPLPARQLLRAPLRRPFEGSGILFRIGFRNAPNGATMLYRKFDVAVRESAIMRFVNSLGFTAMNDYAGKVEAEENRFLAEMFGAMSADVAGLDR